MTMQALEQNWISQGWNQQMNDQAQSGGGRLVATSGVELPLRETNITGRVGGGLGRIVVQQEFVNESDAPLTVTYGLPLPADGAVSGFRFLLDGREVVGEIDTKRKARERYEQALVQGRSAALLEQERSHHFTQKVGNIPPHSTIRCEVTVDQPLRWLDNGSWEWRFPTVLGPRYMGSAGRVKDIERVQVDVSTTPLQHRMKLDVVIEDEIKPLSTVSSSSHEVHVLQTPDGECFVELSAHDEQRMNRDMVLQWVVATEEVQSSLRLARPEKPILERDSVYGLLTLVPPGLEAGVETVARDLVVLLDTSGSMGGQPLEQAVTLLSALIGSLDERDRMHLMEFSDRPRSWKKESVRATEGMKYEAIQWLKSLRASSSTEMHEAVLEAMSMFRPDSQRQVLLITDGYIGFESEIVGTLLKELPPQCRLHTVGVGSSVNRSLTRAAARAGAGIEVLMTPDKEEQQKLIAQLLARTVAPVVTELEIHGEGLHGVVPHALPDLYAGAPALLALELSPETRFLTLEGRMATGRYRCKLELTPVEPGEGDAAIMALYARERVEDLEARLAAQPYSTGPVDQEIEKVGLAYQISTRLTSWVAVDNVISVDSKGPAKEVTMPQEQVAGTKVEAFGLRAANMTAPVKAKPAKKVSKVAAPMRKQKSLSSLSARADKEEAFEKFSMIEEIEEEPAEFLFDNVASTGQFMSFDEDELDLEIAPSMMADSASSSALGAVPSPAPAPPANRGMARPSVPQYMPYEPLEAMEEEAEELEGEMDEPMVVSDVDLRQEDLKLFEELRGQVEYNKAPNVLLWMFLFFLFMMMFGAFLYFWLRNG